MAPRLERALREAAQAKAIMVDDTWHEFQKYQLLIRVLAEQSRMDRVALLQRTGKRSHPQALRTLRIPIHPTVTKQAGDRLPDGKCPGKNHILSQNRHVQGTVCQGQVILSCIIAVTSYVVSCNSSIQCAAFHFLYCRLHWSTAVSISRDFSSLSNSSKISSVSLPSSFKNLRYAPSTTSTIFL